MRYAQTIAIAEALLSEGRARDVLHMLEPLALSPRPSALEDESEIRIRALLARVHLLGSGRVDEAVRLLSPFRRFSDRERLSPETRAHVSLWLGWALAWHDARHQDAPRALGLLHESEKIFISTRNGPGRCWVLLGQAYAYFATDEYRLMRHALDQAEALISRNRDLQAQIWSHDLEAVYARYRLQVKSARNFIAGLHQLAERHNQPLSRARAFAHEAALGVETGEPPSAIVAAADRCLDIMSRLEPRADYPLLTAMRAKAQALLLVGDDAGLESFLDRAEQTAASARLLPAYLGLQRARLSLRQERCEEAQALVTSILEATSGSSHRILATAALLLRAEIAIETGDYATASSAVNEADRKSRLTGYRLHQAKSALLKARIAIREKGAARALQHLADVDRLTEATALIPFAAERFSVLAELAVLQKQESDAVACRIQALSARRIMGDTAGIRKETGALDKLRGQQEEFPVGAVLQRAAGHPRLVADAWIECVKNWHPFEWIAVFQTDGDGRRIVLRETGRQPNELPVSSMHCEQCRAGAIDWMPITESTGNSVHLAVAVPESDAYPAVLSEMRRWLPVAGLAFRHAELNLEASHHCACLDHTEAPAETVDECLTQSPAMEAVLAEVQRIKDGRSPVTIIGEAGSGKAHLAHLMHRMSSRRHAPVVDVSGSDFSDAEGEPFGNGESGSKVDWDGAGMIVLKDIHTAPAAVQQRLARRLERLADIATPVPRIVALFDRDPAEFVRKGSLAEELYDRLNGATIRLPALRERREDIPLLARHFAGQFLAAGVPEPVITAPAMEVLVSYDWPGNIRELQNEVKRAVAAVSAEPLPAVTPADLDERITAARSRRAPRDAADRKELDDVLAGTEKRVIEDALRTNNGQVSASAEALGLTRQGLYKKVKRLGIHLAQFQEETAEAHE